MCFAAPSLPSLTDEGERRRAGRLQGCVSQHNFRFLYLFFLPFILDFSLGASCDEQLFVISLQLNTCYELPVTPMLCCAVHVWKRSCAGLRGSSKHLAAGVSANLGLLLLRWQFPLQNHKELFSRTTSSSTRMDFFITSLAAFP